MDAKTAAPAYMAGEALTFYNKNFPLLFESGAITETDYELFLMTCNAWADVLYWRSQFAKKQDDDDASEIWEMSARAVRQYLALSSKVGMTALDRGKVKREKRKADGISRFRL